jgi:Xaa-Pro aminopeptidase
MNSTAHYGSVWSPDELASRRHELYAARLRRTRELMSKVGIPALLILDSNHIFYATGARNMQIFTLRTPARYLLLFQSGPSILYEYVGCEHLARSLPTIDEIRRSVGLSFVSSGGAVGEASERFAGEIAAAVRAVDPTIDRIGIDRFPVFATDALRRQGFVLVDADDALVPARAIKMPIEIPYLREALRRVDEATARLEAGIAPGRTEAQVWGEFHFDFMQKDGQCVTTRLFQAGARTFPYFHETSDHRMHSGDLVCLDTDAQGFEGYAVDYSRTFLCGDGKPAPNQRTLYQLAKEQLAVNAANLAPGVEFCEFAAKAWPVPEKYRATRYSNLGHGLGLAGEFPNIPHHDPARSYPLAGAVEPGMVICLESYIGSSDDGQGVKLEDQYLVHDDRVECLSRYPYDARLG